MWGYTVCGKPCYCECVAPGVSVWLLLEWVCVYCAVWMWSWFVCNWRGCVCVRECACIGHTVIGLTSYITIYSPAVITSKPPVLWLHNQVLHIVCVTMYAQILIHTHKLCVVIHVTHIWPINKKQRAGWTGGSCQVDILCESAWNMWQQADNRLLT